MIILWAYFQIPLLLYFVNFEIFNIVFPNFRLQPVTDDKPVAALLMAFSRGCGALLELMQLPESPCGSDGYHSEPEQDSESG